MIMKLLIADDDAFTRSGLTKSINWNDYGIKSIETAEDGIQAFEISLWFKPDILLTDVKMPRLDGIELAKKIRESIPDCKIIFMSAYSDKEYLKSAIRLSAVDYVEKPFRPSDVKEIIEKITQIGVKEYSQPSNNASGAWIAQEIVKIVNKEYTDSELSIAYLCERLSLSHSYICVAFKKHTKKTINQYINECRIEMAKLHFGDKKLSFSEIAEKVGYSDQNYFTKVFKRIVKMTPSEYRSKTI